jgi:hypothetical protein
MLCEDNKQLNGTLNLTFLLFIQSQQITFICNYLIKNVHFINNS